jgi:hypothetical protein
VVHGFPLVTHGYGPSPPVGAGEACTPSGCGNFMGMDPGCCAPWATAKASLQDAGSAEGDNGVGPRVVCAGLPLRRPFRTRSAEGDNGVDPEWCAQGGR